MLGWNSMWFFHMSIFPMDKLIKSISTSLPKQLHHEWDKRTQQTCWQAFSQWLWSTQKSCSRGSRQPFSLRHPSTRPGTTNTNQHAQERETMKSNMYECQNILNNKIYIICTLYQKTKNNQNCWGELLTFNKLNCLNKTKLEKKRLNLRGKHDHTDRGWCMCVCKCAHVTAQCVMREWGGVLSCKVFPPAQSHTHRHKHTLMASCSPANRQADQSGALLLQGWEKKGKKQPLFSITWEFFYGSIWILLQLKLWKNVNYFY